MTTSKSELRDLSSAVVEEIEDARGDLIDLCGQLVSAASVNPPGRTAEVAEVVRSYLSSFQIAAMTVKADDEAPNLAADIVGRSKGRHVVFNAHMDTMEASDPAAWSVPILQLTQRDGRLYGLGMGNMKCKVIASWRTRRWPRVRHPHMCLCRVVWADLPLASVLISGNAWAPPGPALSWLSPTKLIVFIAVRFPANPPSPRARSIR